MTYEQNKKGPTLKLAHRSKHFSSVHCPFIFVGLVDKDTMEDLEAMKKNVVDDIKTAIEKKNEILKSLGDSAEKNQQQVKTDSFVRPQDDEDEEEEEEVVVEGKREQEEREKEVERTPTYKKSDSFQVGGWYSRLTQANDKKNILKKHSQTQTNGFKR